MPQILTLCILLSIFLGSCASDNSVEGYATKFCTCSADLAKATVQLKAERIDPISFEKIKAEQEACMGDSNPFAQLKTKQDSLDFQGKFLDAIFIKCPNVARNYGFKE